MTEDLLTMPQALDFVQSIDPDGERPHPSTIQRWRLRGIAGVKLKTWVFNGKRVTTKKWLLEFFDESSASKTERHSKRIRNGKRRAKVDRQREAAEALK